MTAVVPTKAEGLFRDNGEATQAVEDLQQAGFPEDKIEMTERDEQFAALPSRPSRAAPEGCVLGFMVGVLVGIAAITILVGLFPEAVFLANLGLLGAVVVGACAGGLVGGVFGAIIGFFTPRPGWRSRAKEIHRILVTVYAGNRYNDAVKILRRHGAMGRGKPLL